MQQRPAPSQIPVARSCKSSLASKIVALWFKTLPPPPLMTGDGAVVPRQGPGVDERACGKRGLDQERGMQQEQWRRMNRTRACGHRHTSDQGVGDGVHHSDDGKSWGAASWRLRPDNLARGSVEGVAGVVVISSDGVMMRQRADMPDKRQGEHRQDRDDQPVASPTRNLHARQITAWA